MPETFRHFADVRRPLGRTDSRGGELLQVPVICAIDVVNVDEDTVEDLVTNETDEATCPMCRLILDEEAYRAIDPREERASARGDI